MKPEELVKAEKALEYAGWPYGVEMYKEDAVVLVISHNKRVQLRTACLKELRGWLSRRRKAADVAFKKKARENRFMKRCDW